MTSLFKGQKMTIDMNGHLSLVVGVLGEMYGSPLRVDNEAKRAEVLYSRFDMEADCWPMVVDWSFMYGWGESIFSKTFFPLTEKDKDVPEVIKVKSR